MSIYQFHYFLLYFCSASDRFTSLLSMGDDRRCCLIEDGQRCREACTLFPLSEKSERIIRQRGLPIRLDEKAAHIFICEQHRALVASLRPKNHRDSHSTSSLVDDVEVESSGGLNTARPPSRGHKGSASRSVPTSYSSDRPLPRHPSAHRESYSKGPKVSAQEKII